MPSIRAGVHLSGSFQGHKATGTGRLSFLRLRTRGDFICEEDLAQHVRERHGGWQHYRNNIMHLHSKMPPFVGGQIQQAIIRNCSDFLARGSLGWTGFDEDMRAATNCADSLTAAARWKPREWLACVVCAMADWGETRIPVKIGGISCCDDCPPDCSAALFLQES